METELLILVETTLFNFLIGIGFYVNFFLTVLYENQLSKYLKCICKSFQIQ